MPLALTSISVLQFKNYFNGDFRFDERVVAICGRNGVGKTNLLDAIYYLCFTKSNFSRQDQQNISRGHHGFRLEGRFDLNKNYEKAICILRENGKKEFTLNDVAYTKFSRHIGHYPCVMIAPDDVQLIIGHSEERRKFLDTLISQTNPDYLQALINYTKILQQRNSFLKAYVEGHTRDISVLDVLDAQLSKEGDLIYQIRRDFLYKFLPTAKSYYNDIAERYENITLYYLTELQEFSMGELLRQNRQKDLMITRTSAGVHRDDLVFEMDGSQFKLVASQGQRKSLLFALKLAEVDTLKALKGFAPLLLLDDVFEKLDDARINNLLLRVCSDQEGQVFITDTSCERLSARFEQLKLPIQVIEL